LETNAIAQPINKLDSTGSNCVSEYYDIPWQIDLNLNGKNMYNTLGALPKVRIDLISIGVKYNFYGQRIASLESKDYASHT
jgi:hypothetical protein